MASKVGTRIVVFEGHNEIIVTTPAEEKATVKLFFTDGGRDLEEYDRIEIKDVAVEITARLCLS